MFNRAFKSLKNSTQKGSSPNTIIPHDKHKNASEGKGNQNLRASKSYGDIKVEKLDVKPLVQPLSVRAPNMENAVEKISQPRRISRSEIDLDEAARELITARLKHAGRSSKPSSKKVARRVTKREVKNIVLTKFETLAAKNPTFKNFLESHPEYLETMEIDELRETEFSRLDSQGHVYLDYTGGSLYPESLVSRHADILTKGVFGNPHSSNPTSSASTEYEEKVRLDILEFFGADPNEYNVILTNNASGALKLVGESYPFSESRKLILTWDAHNSVNGIREFAKKNGSEIIYVMVDVGDVRVNKEMMKESLDKCGEDRKDSGLFILTGQSNVTGVKADLSWARYARARGWDVLLDASALAPTTQINLTKYPVDYMAVSFYKMFGYPTGVGCLVMRKEAESKLKRPWFGGGSVQLVSVPNLTSTYYEGHRKFEDGTLNYLSLSAVSLGLAFLRPLQKVIFDRISILTGYLIDELTSLYHQPSGLPLVKISGPKTTHLRGGTISFVLTDANGYHISHLLVEEMAKRRKISLRSGWMCNPGAVTAGLGDLTYMDSILDGMAVSEFLKSFDDDLNLLLRISIGIATNWEDCDKFLNFIREFLDPVLVTEMREDFGVIKVTSLC